MQLKTACQGLANQWAASEDTVTETQMDHFIIMVHNNNYYHVLITVQYALNLLET